MLLVIKVRQICGHYYFLVYIPQYSSLFTLYILTLTNYTTELELPILGCNVVIDKFQTSLLNLGQVSLFPLLKLDFVVILNVLMPQNTALVPLWSLLNPRCI